MKKKKERERTRAIQNNLYALKLGWQIAPELVIHMAVARVLGYFEWLFYSAFFMRYVINAMETEQEVTSIFIFLGVTVAVFASMTLYNQYLEGKVWPIASAKVHKKLNLRLFEKSTNVELSCFEDSEFYNKYTLATEGAADKLIDTISNLWGVIFGSIAAVLGFYLMYDIDQWSVLFVIFPIIGNFVFNRKLGQIDFNRNKDMAPHNRRTAYVNRVMYLAEYAKEVRLTNVFSLMRRDYREAIKGVADVTKKYSVKAVILHWFYVQFTFSFIFEGVLIYGAYRTLVNDSMSLAKLAVLTSMMVSCTWILIGFTDYLVAGFKNGLFVDNLRNFLEYEEKIPEDYKGDDPGDTIHSIEFRNVCFSYKDEEVIRNLSFELRGGKTYALVGHNGAGKSTIIKLLMRFYDPTSGEIFLNGRNIKEYELSKYRALFAGAFQDYQIFSMSVLENVLMRKATPEDEAEAIRALKLAGVYEKVESLPKGIHTTLTKEFAEDGAVLSGGELQKIAVARAFAKDYQIAIFDEPSSALDPVAEYQLYENILQECADKTVVFISHRLSTAVLADRIYLFENGRIVEQGSHEMLMQSNGKYADMFRKQAENYVGGMDYAQ